MINIKFPNIKATEQEYILSTVLGDFLGIKFEVEPYSGKVIELTYKGSKSKLTLNTEFFIKSNHAWLKQDSMPELPLKTWDPSTDKLSVDLMGESIPVLFGQSGLVKNSEHWHLNLDIFGSIFFMLSRYEEMITINRDEHNRFPATASTAFKSGFLDRPIVDEYVEILWACLQGLWPELKRKDRQPTNYISCDVDWPFDPALYSIKTTIRRAGSVLINSKSAIKAVNVVFRYLSKRLGFYVKDDFREAISWIMEVNEQEGNTVAFYFITHNTSKLDSNFDFDAFEMRQLFREIYQRGHEIGIHPGYETFNNSVNFFKTVSELKRILLEESILQPHLGGRQHFLMWDTALTPHLWENNGIDYDSTLSFADKAGFRCGTSQEFTMYDIINCKPFKIKQRPLIVMECSIIWQKYEGLGYSNAAIERFKYLKNACHKYGGSFTLLWHNSHLSTLDDRKFYKELIK